MDRILHFGNWKDCLFSQQHSIPIGGEGYRVQNYPRQPMSISLLVIGKKIRWIVCGVVETSVRWWNTKKTLRFFSESWGLPDASYYYTFKLRNKLTTRDNDHSQCILWFTDSIYKRFIKERTNWTNQKYFHSFSFLFYYSLYENKCKFIKNLSF